MSKAFTIETMRGHSDGFYRYIKKIGAAKSRQEEDEIVTKDLQNLKLIYSGNSVDPEMAKEYVVRLIYAEMLGHPAEFGYIHCVNLSAHSRLSFKRAGYLATWLCISPDHELMYLTVANIQKDLRSPNFLEVSAALDGAARFLRPELILALSHDVTGLLTHNKITVRRKAVEALHAFYNRTNGEVADLPAFRQALCDRDPSVMSAAVRLLHDVARRHPRSQQDLLDSFVSILAQVTERRLPRSYDYHHTPAPWLQIALLRLITILVGNDVALAQKVEQTLKETMLRADNGLLIGVAIMCEVVRTAATIPQLPSLVTLCGEAVSHFLTSRSANLRLAGIHALTQLARVDPALASVHQGAVMTCLEDPDDTIRRRTLVLLFAICTADNVQPIVAQFIRFLRRATDVFLRQQTSMAICLAAERYARSSQWYIQTMNRLLAVAGECVPPSSAQRMLKLIAEGQGSEAADTEFRADCVESYFTLMGAGAAGRRRRVPAGSAARAPPRGFTTEEAAAAAYSEPLMRIAAWVMGEYGFLVKRISRAMLLDRLCDMMDRTEETETRCSVVSAMMKLTAHQPEACPENVKEIITRYQDSRSTNLQQRCNEFLALLKLPAVMHKVLPLDGCCEDIHVDDRMSMLDGLVQTAVHNGAKPYDIKAAQRYHTFHEDSAARTGAALRTEAYAPANTWAAAALAGASASALASGPLPSTLAAAAAGDTATAWESQLRLESGGTTRRWGVQNLSAEAPAETGAPFPSSSSAGPDAGLQGAAEAAALSLPTALSRWSLQGGFGPAGTGATDGTDGGASAPGGAWDLQGPADSDNTQRAGSTQPAPVHVHSAKTEKLVSAIFGSGRTTRRRAAPAAAAAAAAASPSAPAEKPRVVPHGATAEALQRRRAAALDDLFGDGPSAGYDGGAQPSSWAAPTTNAMDALFAPSATTGTAMPRAVPSASMLALVVRKSGATQTSLYELHVEVAGTGRVPQVAVDLALPAGCTVEDIHCAGHSQVRLTTPAVANPETCSVVLTDVPTQTSLEVTMSLAVSNPSAFLQALASSVAQRAPLVTTATLSGAEPVKARFDITHVLRPVPSTFRTAQFGEEWVNAAEEAQGQVQVPPSLISVADLAKELAPRAALRVVEVIESEVIAAAELVTRGHRDPVYVLCHCQFSAGGTGATVLMHTRHAPLSASVCQAVCQPN